MGKQSACWECKPFLDWVRTLPCAVTGQPADHVHHLIGAGGMSGMGMKAPDFAVMPLTAKMHELMHRDPELQKMQFIYVLRTLEAAFNEGRLVYKGQAMQHDSLIKLECSVTDLRDQFAGDAMQGLVGQMLTTKAQTKDIARLSYAMADAMLEAREPEKDKSER